jgi:Ca2+-binding RTX toxin-like protein
MTLTDEMLAEPTNEISGTAGNDTINGTAQGDTIFGLGGNDTLNAGAGDDVLHGGEGNDTLRGEEGDDRLYGGVGNDMLFGLTGDDVLDGGLGADRMSGHAGDDIYWVDDAGDFVTESVSDGNDTVMASIHYSVADRINVENVTLVGEADLNATGNAAANILTGNSGANILSGAAGHDTLRGAGGDDRLDGGAGNDVLEGGGGADTYVFGNGYGHDVIVDAGGLAGEIDSVHLLAGVAPAGVSVRASGSDLLLSLNAGTDILTITGWYAQDTRIEQILFADGTRWEWSDLRTQVNRAPEAALAPQDLDVDEDSALAIVLNSSMFLDADPDDVLSLSLSLEGGGELPDWLTYDAQTGLLSGTPANEHVGTLALQWTATDAYGASASARFSLTVNNVNDAPTLVAPIADQTVREGEAFLLQSRFVDVDAADALRYTLSSDSGAVPQWLVLDASSGVLRGTPGNEDVGTWALTITATDNAGASASANFSVIVPVSANRNLVGSAAGDVLAGGSGHDSLRGLAGDDTLAGGAGNDRLDGGDGADLMRGGTGNDTYYVNSALDRVEERPGEGMDTVFSTVSYALSENVESLHLSGPGALNGTGNALDNALYGNGAANVLDGGAGNDIFNGNGGNDTFIGGAGDDLFYVVSGGERIREDAAGGHDRVYAARDYRLSDHVEELVLTGSAIVGGGNARDNRILGTQGANYLDGAQGTDELRGYAGSDVIQGGSGDDVLEGDGGPARTLSIVAFGNGASGVLPRMQVRIDGEIAAEFDVSSTSRTYAIAGLLDESAGHAVDIVFVNDGEGAGENRMLQVTSLTWGETTLRPADSGVVYDVGSGDEAFDGALARQGRPSMQWNGALRFRFDAPVAHDILDGGAGDDRLDGAEGNDLLVGGGGADRIDAGGGANVVLYNLGDGQDHLALTGARLTLSLGGGIDYSDLVLRTAGNDLVLETGAMEGMTIEGWYDPASAKPGHLTLQTITEAMAGFDGSSADTLYNTKVQTFDLTSLVDRFDAARAADANIDRWSVMHALLDARLATSDSEALGGDLAYQYGLQGGIGGIGLGAAQGVTNDSGFGMQMQALRPAAELKQGQVKLA